MAKKEPPKGCLPDVLKWLYWCMVAAGLDSKSFKVLRKAYCTFHVFNYILLTCDLFYAVGSPEVGMLDKMMNGFCGFCILTSSLFMYTMILYKETTLKCINWCHNCINQLNNGHKEIFDKVYGQCAVFSTKILKVIVGICMAGAFFISGVNNTYNALQDEPVMVPNGHLPYIRADTMPKYFINSAHQQTVAAYLTMLFAITFSIVVITMNFVIASMDVMGQVLQKMDDGLATAKNRRQFFYSNFKLVVDLHNEIIEMESSINQLMSKILFSFELCVYGLMFISWVIIYVDPSLLVMVFGAIFIILEYFAICLANERLLDAHNKFFALLYELRWYEWKPKEREMLVPMMMIVLKCKLLTAGQVHVLNYSQFTILIKRGYSVGILFKDMLA